MEKYYCEKCRTLFDEEDICTKCNLYVSKKIFIDVQRQQTKQYEDNQNG